MDVSGIFGSPAPAQCSFIWFHSSARTRLGRSSTSLIVGSRILGQSNPAAPRFGCLLSFHWTNCASLSIDLHPIVMLQPQFERSHGGQSWIEPYSSYSAVSGVHWCATAMD